MQLTYWGHHCSTGRNQTLSFKDKSPVSNSEMKTPSAFTTAPLPPALTGSKNNQQYDNKHLAHTQCLVNAKLYPGCFHLLPHWIFPPPRQAVSSSHLTHKGSLAQHNTAFPRAHRTCADAQNAPHRTSFHSHRQIHTRTTRSRNCKTTNTPSVAPSRPKLITNYIALVTHTNALQPHKSSRRIYTHSQIPRGAVIFLPSTPQSTQ